MISTFWWQENHLTDQGNWRILIQESQQEVVAKVMQLKVEIETREMEFLRVPRHEGHMF